MVFSAELVPKVGQEFRDRVRCVELENLGYSVKTLDDKHAAETLDHGKHCRANFTQPRRMLQSMKAAWGQSIKLDHIILDYFFSPVGWARVRWSDPFFTSTLSTLAQENLISAGGKIWLPNLQCIRESIGRFRKCIDQFYTVHEVEDPMENPLFVATENARAELLRCPEGGLTNQSQLQPILAVALFPFFALVLKDPDHYWTEIDTDMVEKNDNDKPDIVDVEDHASKTLQMWESIISTPKQVGITKLVRVFTGGFESIQSGPFLTAMVAIQRRFSDNVNIVVETLNTSELCKLKWQPDQLMDWSLKCHCHFFIAHIHQSLLRHNLVWDMDFACRQYNRLRYHPGFPSGDQLRCPVFTQDKIKYINDLDTLAIKTMTIPLTEDGTYDHVCLADVQR